MRLGQNSITEPNSTDNHFVRKKFFRHHKKQSSREHGSAERKYEVPEHEFEKRFELKAPPKDVINENKTKETQHFDSWYFRDTNYDLEAAESQFYNHTEVSEQHA